MCALRDEQRRAHIPPARRRMGKGLLTKAGAMVGSGRHNRTKRSSAAASCVLVCNGAQGPSSGKRCARREDDDVWERQGKVDGWDLTCCLCLRSSAHSPLGALKRQARRDRSRPSGGRGYRWEVTAHATNQAPAATCPPVQGPLCSGSVGHGEAHPERRWTLYRQGISTARCLARLGRPHLFRFHAV